MATKKTTPKKNVEALKHDKAKRKNIPTAEYQSVMADDERAPVRVAYERRNRDLDPQLVWRGKDEQDWSNLVALAPPLYIQEKIHPKVLIDDLMRDSKARENQSPGDQIDLFADFNGLPDANARTEFYRHDARWSNRMILGDSLQVMASLAEREGLRGQVQCVYLDPPYGIKFNSNFQWSTTSRDVKDGNKAHISREPEQVKAFRDTWRDGVHSYLTYLRDRLTVARDLLADSGSIFVQIGDENVHRVRALMDEVFGEENFVCLICYKKPGQRSSETLNTLTDFVLWYAKKRTAVKYRQMYLQKSLSGDGGSHYSSVELGDGNTRPLAEQERYDPTLLPPRARVFQTTALTSAGSQSGDGKIVFNGEVLLPPAHKHWSCSIDGLYRVAKSARIERTPTTIRYKRYFDDFPLMEIDNRWDDVGLYGESIYVVQTSTSTIQRCILMTTDPGDLVLDPTCGSGTTAYVSEQWGRRWITIDTSRVALALARARIMGARYPYYLLADSPDGQVKEAAVTRTAPKTSPTYGDIRHGFVYERVPHITLKSIANNAEIDVIWEQWQKTLEPLRAALNKALGTKWEEWEIPRDLDHATAQRRNDKMNNEEDDHATAQRRNEKNNTKKRSDVAPLRETQKRSDVAPSREATELHKQWWEARIARQQEIDASIAAKADFEYLYDKPYIDKGCVRVAGPFTVESLSPHRVVIVDETDGCADDPRPYRVEGEFDFARVALDHLKTSGVQQAHKEDRITFTSITGWPGDYICAEGRFLEGETTRRAGILIGPEYGTVSRPDLAAAVREAGDAGFDVVIACAFNFDVHSSDFTKLGRIPILKARMNPDLHMADELKNTGGGNLFVVFGEPDITIEDAGDNQLRVTINGVDVFHPSTGEIESSGPDGIACWFIDTDYNEESFFVRHAYFLGANDPYKALKTTLKAEIDEEAWESLHRDTSRPFDKPASGRIAVKVINHLGDEVMKVFSV